MGAYRESAHIVLVRAQLALGGWVPLSWENARHLYNDRDPRLVIERKAGPFGVWTPLAGDYVHKPRTLYRARQTADTDAADIIAEYRREYAAAVEFAAVQIWASIQRYEGVPTFAYQMYGGVMEEIET